MQAKRGSSVIIGVGIVLIVATVIGGIIGLGGSSDKGGSRTVFAGKVGAYSLTLNRAPDPPVPDVPSRLTLRVQTAADAQPVDDASVMIVPNMPGMPMPGMTDARFSHTASGQYEVSVPVSMEGYWFFDVKLDNSRLGTAQFRFEDRVEKPATPWALIALLVVGLTVGAGLIAFGVLSGRHDGNDDDDEDAGPSQTEAVSSTARPG